MRRRDLGLVAVGVVVALLAVLGWRILHGPDSGQDSGRASSSGGSSQQASDRRAEDPPGSRSNGGEGSGGEEPTSAALVAGAPPAGRGDLPDASPVTCPTPTTTVASASDLREALASAAPGETIQLEAGTYEGHFTATVSGTSGRPVFLCGPRDAVLDGGSTDDGYGFHLDHASYWRLVGFSVTNSQKGVMADHTVGSVIQGLTVMHTGDEAIHLRDQSTGNVVRDNTISDTGLRKDKFGEGVYVGTAVSNWCEVSRCRVDRSDRNVVTGNDISKVSSEAVDLKEGTTGGVLSANTFDGSRTTGADSWVDVKGNNWLIEGNRGRDAPEDGFQTHQILPGWGDHNVFSRNTGDVNSSGWGITSQPPESNVVTCDNSFSGAGEGASDLHCTKGTP